MSQSFWPVDFAVKYRSPKPTETSDSSSSAQLGKISAREVKKNPRFLSSKYIRFVAYTVFGGIALGAIRSAVHSYRKIDPIIISEPELESQPEIKLLDPLPVTINEASWEIPFEIKLACLIGLTLLILCKQKKRELLFSPRKLLEDIPRLPRDDKKDSGGLTQSKNFTAFTTSNRNFYRTDSNETDSNLNERDPKFDSRVIVTKAQSDLNFHSPKEWRQLTELANILFALNQSRDFSPVQLSAISSYRNEMSQSYLLNQERVPVLSSLPCVEKEYSSDEGFCLVNGSPLYPRHSTQANNQLSHVKREDWQLSSFTDANFQECSRLGEDVDSAYKRLLENLINKREESISSQTILKIDIEQDNIDRFHRLLASLLKNPKDVPTKNLLALCYLQGIGVDKNPDKAFELYKEIVEEFYPAKLSLAKCYAQGIGTKRNQQLANELYNELAQYSKISFVDFIEAKYQLLKQEDGEDLDQKVDEVLNLYIQEESKKESLSVERRILLNEYGLLFWSLRSEIELVRAVELLANLIYNCREAVNREDSKAQLIYAWHCEQGSYFCNGKNDQLALLLYEVAAKNQNPDALLRLAIAYEKGHFGLREDKKRSNLLYQEVLESYRRQASLGDLQANNKLAICYALGLGGEEKHEQALLFFQKGVLLGHAEAAFNLATCYKQGLLNIEINEEESFKLYRQAALLGCPQAISKLMEEYEKKGISATEEDIKLFTKLATLPSDGEAAFSLANCYETGRLGIKEDKDKAMTLYLWSATQGNFEAIKKVSEFLDSSKNLEGGQLNTLLTEWINRELERRGDESGKTPLFHPFIIKQPI